MSLAFSVRAGDPARAATPLLAVALAADSPLPRALAALDKAYGGALSKALKRKDFSGARDDSLLLFSPGRGPERVLLVGLGSAEPAKGITRAATLAGRKANSLGVGRLDFWAAGLADAALEGAVIGVSLGSWEFREFHAPLPAAQRKNPLRTTSFFVSNARGAKAALAAGVAVAEGQRITRRLQMLPSNICTPEYIARAAREIGKRHGLRVQVFGRRDLTRLKMGSFLAVAQGTAQDPAGFVDFVVG